MVKVEVDDGLNVHGHVNLDDGCPRQGPNPWIDTSCVPGAAHPVAAFDRGAAAGQDEACAALAWSCSPALRAVEAGHPRRPTSMRCCACVGRSRRAATW